MALASVKSDSGFVDNWQSGKSLAECNIHMFTSEDSCDASFRVGKDKKIVRAHRYVLISRSCVFHAMLCGPLAEKDEITITDVEADIFTELLRFLYTNESDPNPVNVTGLLYLAKKYAVGGLEHLCLSYLKSSLSAENACVILEQAHVFDEKQLYDRALKSVIENQDKCLATEGFKHLCRECFDKMITQDASPQQVFSAAILWSEEECRRQRREIIPANLRSVLGETLYRIPFPSMGPKYFVDEVLPRQILTSDETVIIMSHQVRPEKDPSPFKKKTLGAEPGTLESADVVFYNQHRKVKNFKQENAVISFVCSQNIVLTGIYMYGSATVANSKYQLKVRKCYPESIYVPFWILDSEHLSSLSSKFKDHNIQNNLLKETIAYRERYEVHDLCLSG